MKLDAMSFFKLASQRMEWLTARQKVVSENIANADTPKYQSRDVVSFDSFLASRADAEVSADPMDLLSTRSEVETVTTDSGWGQSFDGNTVDIEQQSVLGAENADQYQLAARIYKKGYEMLSLAAGKAS